MDACELYRIGLTAAATTVFFASANACHAISVSDIKGRWNHDSTGENILISSNKDVQDDRLGQGRISTTTGYAANFRIVYQDNKKCWYYVTLTNAKKRMNLAVRNKNQSADTCLRGPFNLAQ